MLGKSRHAVVILLVLSTALMVPEAAFALVPPPPEIMLEFERGGSAAPKCPAEYTIKLIPIGFQGAVNLTLVNLPKGARADIFPNPTLVPFWGEGASVMTVDVSPDTPNGTYKIHVTATPLSGPGGIYDKNYSRGDGYFTLVVGKCGEPLSNETTTTTSTTTSTVSTTTTTVTNTVTNIATTKLTETTTRISMEPNAEPSTYAWAVSATVAAVVLAVVLLLQRRHSVTSRPS